MAKERSFYIRYDVRPTIAVDAVIEVNESVIKVKAAGLTGPQSIPVLINAGLGADIHWTPYSPCGVPVVLTAANTLVELTTEGRYKIDHVAVPVGSLVVSVKEDVSALSIPRQYNLNPAGVCPKDSATGGSNVNIEADLQAVLDILSAPCGDPTQLKVEACGVNPLLTSILAALTSAQDGEIVVRCDSVTGQQVLVVFNVATSSFSFVEFPTGGPWTGNPVNLVECDSAANTVALSNAAGINSSIPAGYRAVHISKISTVGTVEVLMGGNIYPLTRAGESINQAHETGRKNVTYTLPGYSISAIGGATWKWHAVI